MFIAGATPMGPLTADTYETLVGEVLSAIQNAGHLDGLFLYLPPRLQALAKSGPRSLGRWPGSPRGRESTLVPRD